MFSCGNPPGSVASVRHPDPTAETPAEYAELELFHESNLPRTYSDNWTAPRTAAELQLLTGPGETPVLPAGKPHRD